MHDEKIQYPERLLLRYRVPSEVQIETTWRVTISCWLLYQPCPAVGWCGCHCLVYRQAY